MANLDTIVNINITRASAAVAQAGFGVMLLLSRHVRFTERTRTYTGLDAVLSDFDSDDPVAIAATRAFAQELQPEEIKVGRIQVDSVTVSVDDVQDDTEYKITINGTEFTFTSDATATAAEIATGLDAAINGGSEPVTSTDNGDGTYTLTTDTAGDAFTAIPDAKQSIDQLFEREGVSVDTVVDSTVYTVTINRTAFTFNSGISATAASIAAGLVAAVNAGSEPVTAIDDTDGTFRLLNDTQGTFMSVAVDSNMSIEAEDESVTDAITAIDVEDNDWYALVNLSRLQSEVEETMNVIETQRRFWITTSNDSGIPDTTLASDPGTIAKFNVDNAFDRASVWYDKAPEIYPEAGLFGLQLPKQAGSSNYDFQTLSGVAVITVTDTQQTNLDDKFVGTYQRIGGINQTIGFKVGANEFPDIIIGIDWIDARLQEDVFRVISENEKVGGDDAGIELVATPVRQRLNIATQPGIDILTDDPAPIVNVPLAADRPAADRQSRTLNGLTFSAQAKGAINKVNITGTVSI